MSSDEFEFGSGQWPIAFSSLGGLIVATEHVELGQNSKKRAGFGKVGPSKKASWALFL